MVLVQQASSSVAMGLRRALLLIIWCFHQGLCRFAGLLEFPPTGEGLPQEGDDSCWEAPSNISDKSRVIFQGLVFPNDSSHGEENPCCDPDGVGFCLMPHKLHDVVTLDRGSRGRASCGGGFPSRGVFVFWPAFQRGLSFFTRMSCIRSKYSSPTKMMSLVMCAVSAC